MNRPPRPARSSSRGRILPDRRSIKSIDLLLSVCNPCFIFFSFLLILAGDKEFSSLNFILESANVLFKGGFTSLHMVSSFGLCPFFIRVIGALCAKCSQLINLGGSRNRSLAVDRLALLCILCYYPISSLRMAFVTQNPLSPSSAEIAKAISSESRPACPAAFQPVA